MQQQLGANQAANISALAPRIEQPAINSPAANRAQGTKAPPSSTKTPLTGTGIAILTS